MQATSQNWVKVFGKVPNLLLPWENQDEMGSETELQVVI